MLTQVNPSKMYICLLKKSLFCYRFLLKDEGNFVYYEEPHLLWVEDPEPLEEEAGDQCLPRSGRQDRQGVVP